MKNDWIKIKNYYIFHSISLEKLAKKFRVSISAVNKHCRLENWVEEKEKKCQKIDRKVAEKTEKQEIDKKVAANMLHTKLYDKGLEVINMLLEMYMTDIKEGKKKTKASACNIDYLMSAVAKAQKGQRLSLNIGDEIADNTEPEVHIISGLDMDDICEFPDEMARLLREYRNNPTQEVLDTIESQFSVETLKDVAGREALFKGQLLARDNLTRESQIRQSAQEYLNVNVNKYAEDFKNPAFTALYGEAFRAYGCDLNTDKFVELMKNYASSIAKASGIKNGINLENANATNEIAGLSDGKGNASAAAGSGKSLLNMSEKELDKRLSELI